MLLLQMLLFFFSNFTRQRFFIFLFIFNWSIVPEIGLLFRDCRSGVGVSMGGKGTSLSLRYLLLLEMKVNISDGLA